MKQIMISLDKKIFDKSSRVASRIVEYGKEKEIFVLIPEREAKEVALCESVFVYGSGGKNKFFQFFNLLKKGKNICKGKNIEEVTTQDPFFTGFLGTCLKRRYKLKLEVQLHGDFFSSDYYKKNNYLKFLLAKYVIKKADKLRVVSERIKESLLSLGINVEKIELRPIVVDKESIEKHETNIDLHKKYPSYEKIFLALGRLDKVKNLSWLIDVFAKAVKDDEKLLLLIVGSGSEKDNLLKKAKEYNLDNNIKFEDWTNDPISYLKTTDCLLFPSLSEGYGLVVIEALYSGCKVISNDVGVLNYEVKPSERVQVVNVNDKESWVKAILDV